MKRSKKIIIGVVIMVAVIAGMAFYVRSKRPMTTYTTADVVKGNLSQTVSVTGDLVANEEITLNFELGGRIGEVFVKPSDQVAAGEKIATLVDSTLQKELEQARAALDRAVADAGSNDDALHEAEVEKKNAENTLDETKDLNRKNIEAAESAVDRAQKYYNDAKDFYEGDPTAANKLTLTTAENNLEAAKKALEVERKQADLAKVGAENNVDSAKARLKTVESKFASKSRDAQVAQARAAYDIALLNLDKATLISPVNGIITEVNNKKGEILGTGVIKESFSRVMSLDMIIESQVPESDIVKLKLEQHAKITFDSLTSEDVFDAEIIEIDPASTTIQDVVYYKIKLKINSIDPRVKPGMSANVDIATAEKEGILMIPMRAVKSEEKKKYVDVLQADNTTKKIYVETGLEGDDGLVEIKSGLREGEKVVTFVSAK